MLPDISPDEDPVDKERLPLEPREDDPVDMDTRPLEPSEEEPEPRDKGPLDPEELPVITSRGPEEPTLEDPEDN